MRSQTVGQHARNVLQQAAAGDVRQCFDRVRRQGRQHALDIQPGRRHHRLAERLPVQRGRQRVAGALNAFAHQAEAVGVHAAGPQAQHHITGLDVLPSQNFGLLDHAHRKTGQVVLAHRVHARHFGGFATNQGAARQLASTGNAAYHRGGCVNVELAAGKVIQKKQGLSPLHQNIIHAHGHQVYAHRVVHVPFKGELELGAHAIGAAHQHRLAVALGHFKQGAKAADAGQHAFAHGLACQRFDALDQRITGVDVDTCVLVRQGRGALRLRHGGWL